MLTSLCNSCNLSVNLILTPRCKVWHFPCVDFMIETQTKNLSTSTNTLDAFNYISDNGLMLRITYRLQVPLDTLTCNYASHIYCIKTQIVLYFNLTKKVINLTKFRCIENLYFEPLFSGKKLSIYTSPKRPCAKSEGYTFPNHTITYSYLLFPYLLDYCPNLHMLIEYLILIQSFSHCFSYLDNNY